MQIEILAGARTRVNLVCGTTTALLASAALTPCWAASLPNCTDLAAQILTNPDIVAATSVLVPAAGANLAYCNIQLQYSHLAGPAAGYAPGQRQLIQIGIGLPLSAADGGSGGVQGAWTGRIEDLGGGGTAGSVGSTTAATNLGNVGSSTDTGHSATTVGGSGSYFPLNGIVGTFPGGTFTAALNPPNDNSFNWGIYADFAYRGIHAQSLMSKSVTQLYYGMTQNYSYWSGCSEGGHQGMSEAMRYPNDHNGLLIGDPVMMYDRLQPMQFWGQVITNHDLGAEISITKQTAVSNAAIAQCQNNFGGTPDGIIQEPRACPFSAYQYVCGQPGANINGVPDTTNCLTDTEATDMNEIWTGVSNDSGAGGGGVLYPGWSRGADTTTQNSPNGPGSTNLDYAIDYTLQDPLFNWKDFTSTTFQDMILSSEQKFSQLQGVDDANWSRFNALGNKAILYHGLADQNVPDRGSDYFYGQLMAHDDNNLAATQSYIRYYRYPGNQHCGGTKLQPNAPILNTTDMLTALENWVENGQAPNAITAYNNANHSLATITRPVCKYPDTLSYTGSGSIFDAANFTCVTQTTDPLANSWQMADDIGTNGQATEGRMTYGITDTHDLAAINRSSSIVFRDNKGNVRVWLLNGTELSKPGNPSTIVQDTAIGNVSTDWSLVGQDDFVGHGFASLLWYDKKDDSLAVWAMNGVNVENVTTLSPLPSNRSVVATGSFTNNNTMQHVGGILWEDNKRNLYVSVTNNGQLASTSSVGVLPANSMVVGADLNGWIFLRNTVSGEVSVWVLQLGGAQCAAALPPTTTGGAGSDCGPGPTIALAVAVGSMPSNWSIAGIGDFDGDGYSDILWRDNQGDVRIWLLGTTPTSLNIRSSADLGNVPPNWSIVQTGDYNGDGFSDILWEDNTGNLKAWFMQGTTVAKTQILGNIGSKWTVQSLNDQ